MRFLNGVFTGVFFGIFCMFTLPPPAFGVEKLIMGTTAQIVESGLADYLKPLALREVNIDLSVTVLESGKARERAGNCAAQVLLLPEEQGVIEDFALDRREVLHDASGRRYFIMTVNPALCPKVDKPLAEKFEDWWICAGTQAHLEAFRSGEQQIFSSGAPLLTRR